jgi:hypothetical protein
MMLCDVLFEAESTRATEFVGNLRSKKMSGKVGSSCRKSGTDYQYPRSTVDIEKRQI